jgi:hypothetical protein
VAKGEEALLLGLQVKESSVRYLAHRWTPRLRLLIIPYRRFFKFEAPNDGYLQK